MAEIVAGVHGAGGGGADRARRRRAPGGGGLHDVTAGAGDRCHGLGVWEFVPGPIPSTNCVSAAARCRTGWFCRRRSSRGCGGKQHVDLGPPPPTNTTGSSTPSALRTASLPNRPGARIQRGPGPSLERGLSKAPLSSIIPYLFGSPLAAPTRCASLIGLRGWHVPRGDVLGPGGRLPIGRGCLQFTGEHVGHVARGLPASEARWTGGASPHPVVAAALCGCAWGCPSTVTDTDEAAGPGARRSARARPLGGPPSGIGSTSDPRDLGGRFRSAMCRTRTAKPITSRGTGPTSPVARPLGGRWAAVQRTRRQKQGRRGILRREATEVDVLIIGCRAINGCRAVPRSLRPGAHACITSHKGRFRSGTSAAPSRSDPWPG